MERQIKLYYGYQETECGIFHSFVAVDPDEDYPEESSIVKDLASMLDAGVDDDNFNYDSMYINIPDSAL